MVELKRVATEIQKMKMLCFGVFVVSTAAYTEVPIPLLIYEL